MNKWLYFLSGIAIGAVSGVVGHKLWINYKEQKEFEENFEEYEDISDEYLRHESEVNPNETNTGRESGAITAQQRDEIRAKLKKNYEGTTNYASMYKGDNAAEEEHPVDSDEDEPGDEYFEDSEESEDDILKEAEVNATLEHEKNKNKPPKIISYDAVTELPEYIEQCDLFYYTGDDVLANEAEEELDPETFVGDALWKYGFSDNDEHEIYVMNYALDTCYCVMKVNGAFADLKG